MVGLVAAQDRALSGAPERAGENVGGATRSVSASIWGGRPSGIASIWRETLLVNCARGEMSCDVTLQAHIGRLIRRGRVASVGKRAIAAVCIAFAGAKDAADQPRSVPDHRSRMGSLESMIRVRPTRHVPLPFDFGRVLSRLIRNLSMPPSVTIT